jgi:hypothetical protein
LAGEKVELALHLVFNILKVFLNIWFEHIVYRGYLYMLDRAEATPLLATTANQSPVGFIFKKIVRRKSKENRRCPDPEA